MIKVEHKKNDVHRKILRDRQEAKLWLRDRKADLYGWEHLSKGEWVKIRNINSRLAAEAAIELVFGGVSLLPRYKYIWSTKSWRFVA